MFWAALSMTAALVMTACSCDDNMMTPAALQGEVKTIPYSVTVNEGVATNRASVDSDNKTLKFAAGDKLYITGTNISGVLALKSGDEGKSSGATFEGDLTYSGAGSPASDLALTATLVSAQQTDGTEVTINSTTKAVTVNYPTTAYCADVATAVQKYSNLTGTSTYSSKSFTLSQNTAFLNFEITFVDNTTTGTKLSTVVKNGETTLCTANVTTTTVDTKVVAKFVLPVAKNTALSGATVKMGDKAALTINNATLTGKVYNVKKTQKAIATAHALSASVVGDVVGSDGKAYTLDATHVLPSGVTAVAMVAYKNGSNGLAVALNYSNDTMAFGNVQTYLNNLTTISGGSWILASKDQWVNMLVACKVDGDSSSIPTNGIMTCNGFFAKMTAAGWNEEAMTCWTNTANGYKQWNVTPNKNTDKVIFGSAEETKLLGVLPILSF